MITRPRNAVIHEKVSRGGLGIETTIKIVRTRRFGIEQ